MQGIGGSIALPLHDGAASIGQWCFVLVLLDRSGCIAHPSRSENRSSPGSVIDPHLKTVQDRADRAQKHVNASPSEQQPHGPSIRVRDNQRSGVTRSAKGWQSSRGADIDAAAEPGQLTASEVDHGFGIQGSNLALGESGRSTALLHSHSDIRALLRSPLRDTIADQWSRHIDLTDRAQSNCSIHDVDWSCREVRRSCEELESLKITEGCDDVRRHKQTNDIALRWLDERISDRPRVRLSVHVTVAQHVLIASPVSTTTTKGARRTDIRLVHR